MSFLGRNFALLSDWLVIGWVSYGTSRHLPKATSLQGHRKGRSDLFPVSLFRRVLRGVPRCGCPRSETALLWRGVCLYVLLSEKRGRNWSSHSQRGLPEYQAYLWHPSKEQKPKPRGKTWYIIFRVFCSKNIKNFSPATAEQKTKHKPFGEQSPGWPHWLCPPEAGPVSAYCLTWNCIGSLGEV